MSTYSHQMESKKSVSPSMRALLFHSKLSHLSKKNIVEWLFAPFLFHYTLKECEQCQEEQFVQDHFILGIKSDLYLRHHTLFVKTNWLLSFGSELRALDSLLVTICRLQNFIWCITSKESRYCDYWCKFVNIEELSTHNSTAASLTP